MTFFVEQSRVAEFDSQKQSQQGQTTRLDGKGKQLAWQHHRVTAAAIMHVFITKSYPTHILDNSKRDECMFAASCSLFACGIAVESNLLSMDDSVALINSAIESFRIISQRHIRKLHQHRAMDQLAVCTACYLLKYVSCTKFKVALTHGLPQLSMSTAAAYLTHNVATSLASDELTFPLAVSVLHQLSDKHFQVGSAIFMS